MAYSIYPTITITVTTTATGILSLLLAADANCPPRCREYRLQFDPRSAGGATYVIIGKTSTLTANNCGFVLQKGESTTYRSDSEPDAAPIALQGIMTDTGTATLNVEIIPK